MAKKQNKKLPSRLYRIAEEKKVSTRLEKKLPLINRTWRYRAQFVDLRKTVKSRFQLAKRESRRKKSLLKNLSAIFFPSSELVFPFVSSLSRCLWEAFSFLHPPRVTVSINFARPKANSSQPNGNWRKIMKMRIWLGDTNPQQDLSQKNTQWNLSTAFGTMMRASISLLLIILISCDSSSHCWDTAMMKNCERNIGLKAKLRERSFWRRWMSNQRQAEGRGRKRARTKGERRGSIQVEWKETLSWGVYKNKLCTVHDLDLWTSTTHPRFLAFTSLLSFFHFYRQEKKVFFSFSSPTPPPCSLDHKHQSN